MIADDDASEDYLTHYLGLAHYKWIFAASIGAFLAVFMLAFQPFGVTNYDPKFSINLEFVLVIAAFGLLSSASIAFSEFILRPLLLGDPTRRQLIAWLGWDFVLVGSVVFVFYNFMGDWHDLHWTSYFGFIRDVGMVMVFPVAGFLFYIRHESLHSRYVHLSSFPASPRSRELLHLTSDNEKDVLSVAVDDLLYLESQDNYLAVVFMDSGQRRSSLIRSSLKRIEAMAGTQLTRCHRSFMVNLRRVRACHGNQHGLKLTLEGNDDPIPVSRGYTQVILDELGAAARD
jgi:hypothetical protein